MIIIEKMIERRKSTREKDMIRRGKKKMKNMKKERNIGSISNRLTKRGKIFKYDIHHKFVKMHLRLLDTRKVTRIEVEINY